MKELGKLFKNCFKYLEKEDLNHDDMDIFSKEKDSIINKI